MSDKHTDWDRAVSHGQYVKPMRDPGEYVQFTRNGLAAFVAEIKGDERRRTDMNLDDALRCIFEHMSPRMTVETWILGDGKMMRRVRLDGPEVEFMCRDDEQFAEAIKAAALLARLPDLEGFNAGPDGVGGGV